MTNCQAAAHESLLVRCSPQAADFSRSNPLYKFFQKTSTKYAKKNTSPTIIVVLNRLKLPYYEEVHEVCRRLYVFNRQNIV